jgi:UDP-glucose 4-epimerase
MKVLITGGMGVIGAEATRKFVLEGHRPVVYARRRDERLIGDILDRVDIELGDITDAARLTEVLQQHAITHIVHAAGYVSAPSAANVPLGIQVNVMGTTNVLEAARQLGIQRVVYTSAKGVYGPFLGVDGYPTYQPIAEDHPKNPWRIYDAAKLMAEHTCLYYNATFGVDVAILRFATTFGPGKTERHGLMGVTSQIIEAPAHGRPFHLKQGGDEKDDFIYNKDSALGIYLATVAEQVEGRVYNIGSGIGRTLNDFADVLRRRLPNADIEIGPGLNFLGVAKPLAGIYDISRARKELGYEPQYDLERAIDDYLANLKRLDAYAEQGAV